jgi:hypothetical protein
MKLIEHVINCRDRKSIFDDYIIKCSIVSAKPPRNIFFFTNKTRDEKGLVLDFISPNFNMS